MTPFKTPSRLTRSLSAAAAMLTTVMLLASVAGLALHYEQDASMQMAAAAPSATSAAPAV